MEEEGHRSAAAVEDSLAACPICQRWFTPEEDFWMYSRIPLLRRRSSPLRRRRPSILLLRRRVSVAVTTLVLLVVSGAGE